MDGGTNKHTHTQQLSVLRGRSNEDQHRSTGHVPQRVDTHTYRTRSAITPGVHESVNCGLHCPARQRTHHGERCRSHLCKQEGPKQNQEGKVHSLSFLLVQRSSSNDEFPHTGLYADFAHGISDGQWQCLGLLQRDLDNG